MSEEPSYNISDYDLPECMTSSYTTPDKYASFVLCPSGQTLDDLSKNLVLIDKRVKDYETIISCLMPNTEYILFDIDLDDLTTLKNKIVGNYQHIGLLQHNTSYNEHVNSYYVVVNGETISVSPVGQTNETDININTDNTDNMFIDSSGVLYDIGLVQFNTSVHKRWKMVNNMKLCQIDCNGDYSSWSDFLDFLDFLKDKTQYFDLMACKLWSDNDWIDVIIYMSNNYLTVRASSNNTGMGGDFILESHQISMIGVYFTPGVLEYKYELADNFPYNYASSATFSAYSIVSSQNNRNLGLCMTATGSTRVALFNTFIGIFYRRIINDVWGTFSSTTLNYDVTPFGENSVVGGAVTPDARRYVVAAGTFGAGGVDNYIYWCDASGLLNGTSSTLNFKKIPENTTRFYPIISITNDGSRFVATGYINSVNSIYFSNWNGTNYNTLTLLSGTSGTVAHALSSTGDILAYSINNTAYWSI